jgi:acyl-homoserine lactone acylase PvdQ
MKKLITDKIGTVTTKLHNTKNKLLIVEERFHFIKKIVCYTSEDGIHGFFPIYKDENLNNEILEQSFYNDFQKNHLEKLNSKLISHKQNLTIINLEFSDKEVINSMVCRYDESHQKIVVIKIKTTKDIYVVGDRMLLNKSLPKITKENHFIPGMKVSFSQDNNMIYLSSVQAYFESDDNYHKYIVTKSSRNYLSYLLRGYELFENLLFKASKIMFVLMFIIAVALLLLKSSTNFSGGDIIIEERGLLHDLVKIHTDEHGFPHIEANNIQDSYFAIGFVHAKERLWQMEFLRRLARGKLSEIFGEKTLELDRFIRSIGMNYISEKNAEFFMYNSENFRTFQKYIDGINYYATYYPLPIEYKLTFITNNFKYWELADSIAIANLVTFTLSHDWENEIWHKFIEENLGKEFADVIISFKEMNHPFSNESVITDDELVELNMHKNRKKSDEGIKMEREKAEKIAKQQRLKEEKEFEKKLNERQKLTQKENLEAKIKENNINITYISNENNKENDIIGNLASNGASNSWVISGKHTHSGKPILSNDPHLQHSIPSNLFVIKVYLPDNTLSGSTQPGLPFLIIGSNKDLSWGVTTENGDLIDICEEKIENDHYIYDNKKHKMVEIEEIIDIKGGSQEKIITKWTRSGPILNKIHRSFHKMNFEIKFDIPLSIRIYNYLFDFTSFDYYFKVNYASNPQAFYDESDKFVSGNFHLIWATKSEIGYLPLGKFTVKSYKNRLCRGYTSKDDVGKFLKRTELPLIINPKKGFIVTANNRFVNFNFTYSLTGNHNHVRAYRIRELIENKIKNLEKFDIKDNINIIQDRKDALAGVILPQILDIYERNLKKNINNKNQNINIQNYYDLLRNWDYVLRKNSTEATIYSVLEYNIGKNLLVNKLPLDQANGLLNTLSYWNFVSGIIQKIHSEDEVEMSQCASITGSKNCEKYIYSIFNNLETYLEDFKDSINNVKKWGEILYHVYPHRPGDSFPYINGLFSRKISTGGNRNTVNLAKGSFNFNAKNPFVSLNSANYKMVCDMNEPTTPYLILNTGNSGNLFSKFYDNFITKNENGELIKFENIDLKKIEKADFNTLFLNPLYPINKQTEEVIRSLNEKDIKNKGR